MKVPERADFTTDEFKKGSRWRKNVEQRYLWANRFAKGVTLDIPVGIGSGGSLLTNADSIIGVDISEEAIKKGKFLYSNIKFIHGDMTNIPLNDDSIDYIVCCEGYEHLVRENQFKLINEMYRVLKPAGKALMSMPISNNCSTKGFVNKYHLYTPTRKEVMESLDGKFEISEMLSRCGIQIRNDDNDNDDNDNDNDDETTVSEIKAYSKKEIRAFITKNELDVDPKEFKKLEDLQEAVIDEMGLNWDDDNNDNDD